MEQGSHGTVGNSMSYLTQIIFAADRDTAIWEVSTLDRDRVPYAQDYFPERIMKRRRCGICGGANNVGCRVDSHGALPQTPGFSEAWLRCSMDKKDKNSF